jgi:hypothetical protein
MESPVDESGRSRRQGVDALLGEKDRVAGGFGELLDAGGDVDGVTDEGELELAAAADGSGDHHTGVDPDADPKRAIESFGDTAVNQHRGAHSGALGTAERCSVRATRNRALRLGQSSALSWPGHKIEWCPGGYEGFLCKAHFELGE